MVRSQGSWRAQAMTFIKGRLSMMVSNDSFSVFAWDRDR